MSSKTKYTGYDGKDYEIPGGLKWDKCFSISQLEKAWYKCYGEKLPEQYDGFIKELISIASTMQVDGQVKKSEDFTFEIEGAQYSDKSKVEKLIKDNLDEMFETGILWDAYKLPLHQVFDDIFYSDDDTYTEIVKDITNFNDITITVHLDNPDTTNAEIYSVR